MTPARRCRLTLLSLTAALTACQPATEAPSASTAEADYSITLTGAAGTVRTIGIIDRSELLAAAPEGIVPPVDSGGFTVERMESDPRIVAVIWEGGCPADPVLTLHATDTELVFDLFPGHAPPSCPAAGELFGLGLTFKASTADVDLVTDLEAIVLESQQP